MAKINKLDKPEYIKKIKNIIIAVAIIALITYFMTIITVMNYTNNLEKQISNAGEINSVIIKDEIQDNFDYLEFISTTLFDSKAVKKFNISKNSTTGNTNFFEITLADMSGQCSIGGENSDISSTEFFKIALSGKKYINLVEDFFRGEDVIVFSMPFVLNGEISFVAAGFMSLHDFSNIINIGDYTNTKDVFLIHPSGVLLSDNTSNYFENIMEENASVKKSIRSISDKIYNGDDTTIIYRENNEKVVSHLTQFGFNEWLIVSQQKSNVLIHNHSHVVLYAVIGIIIIILLAIATFMLVSKIRKKFKENEEIFVRSNNILFDSANCTMFEYRFKDQLVKFSSYGCKHYDIREGFIPTSDVLRDCDVLYETHKELLQDYYERINSGIRYNEAFCKLKPQGQEQYVLHKVTSTTVYDLSGKPVKALGIVEKIHKENDDLDDIVINDTLTGLYNRVALKNMINGYAKYNKEEKGAYILVDINNFKLINEKLGYREGDQIIISIANNLRQLFRSSDIIARTSYDEFSIFMKNISSNELIEKRVVSILVALDNILPKDKKIKSSVNIGVALYPDDSNDFNKLYNNAKVAMKEARANSTVYSYYSDETL